MCTIDGYFEHTKQYGKRKRDWLPGLIGNQRARYVTDWIEESLIDIFKSKITLNCCIEKYDSDFTDTQMYKIK